MSGSNGNGKASKLKVDPEDAECVLRAVSFARKAGLAVLPPTADGIKRPYGDGPGAKHAWNRFHSELATDADVARWYSGRSPIRLGIGLVCGAVSGGLEVVDFDDEATYFRFIEAAGALGLGDLVTRIEAGYLEATPKDGRHWLYRCDGFEPRSTKLAMRPATAAGQKAATLIETKGEGGFIVVSPSCGPTHPSGESYDLLKGGFDTITTLTEAERDAIWNLARSFDETPEPDADPPAPSGKPARGGADGETRPGDDYNARMTWDAILAGWTKVFTRGDMTYWKRPGKDEAGISATTGRTRADRLNVYSNATPFESVLENRKTYDKFGAYALLNYRGEPGLAAKALAEQGYGTHAVPVHDEDGRLLRYDYRQNPRPKGERRNGKSSANGYHGANGKPPEGPIGPAVAEDDRGENARLAGRPRTDLGNAERLVARHGQDLRFCHPWSKWLAWDGRRWKLDNTAAVRRLAKAAVRKIIVEAATVEDDEQRKAHVKWALASENRARIDAMLALASAEADVPILPDDMDPDPWLFNCLNGTIDLRTGTLRPHRREDLITTLCPLRFDPGAACPLWEATLRLFFADDDRLIAYWQRICGYAMVGVIRDHIMPIAYGKGSNGKSTVLGSLLGVFGCDYAMKCPPDLLMAKRMESHPTDRADLFKKRLVVAIETEAGRRLNETMVKELTGGDRIRARRMKEDFWEFAPTHTLLMATNHKPVIRGTDRGIWRRLKLVPFTVSVEGRDDDTAMPEKLQAEYPGILAWCVRGCLAWQEIGLQEPDSVAKATGCYRQEQDLVGIFLDQFTVRATGIKVRANDLYGRYQQWAEAGNEHVMTLRMFGQAMEERGVEKRKSNGIWYQGIGLLQTDSNPDDVYR